LSSDWLLPQPVTARIYDASPDYVYHHTMWLTSISTATTTTAASAAPEPTSVMATTTAHSVATFSISARHFGILPPCESGSKSRSPFWSSLLLAGLRGRFVASESRCIKGSG